MMMMEPLKTAENHIKLLIQKEKNSTKALWQLPARQGTSCGQLSTVGAAGDLSTACAQLVRTTLCTSSFIHRLSTGLGASAASVHRSWQTIAHKP
jgi:hypothetical protein